ncbi:hypothetical protein HPP92_011629 [Vanilla planifolia]|uniref:VQ domain-containing protein n=1 Tax=Vanilla planifolia TaxID=51239 RepID=A0A835R159_VANPL|nr:hypothetical protein HPP92_011629 [Vanilla planifolia]
MPILTTILKLHMNSNKFNKPILTTATSRRRRPPMTIYTVSPKVIHAEPGEFRSLVQSLTGCCTCDEEASPVETSAGFVDGKESLAFWKISFQGSNFWELSPVSYGNKGFMEMLDHWTR